jgi:hypothetical protein
MWFGEKFCEMAKAGNATMPSRRVAESFSVETSFHPAPFGVHAPWRHLEDAQMKTLTEHCPEIKFMM